MDNGALSQIIEEMRSMRDRLRQLENGVPLQNASVTRGRLRFEGGQLLIDSGGQLIVIGTASIDGQTTVNGTFLLTGNGWRIIGSGSIEGPTTVVGTLKIDGDTRITGNLGLEGDVMLSGSLSVEDGQIINGEVRIAENVIYIGQMVLDPEVAGGALRFPNGSRLEADDDNGGARLIAGNAVVNVGDVASMRKGPSSVIVSTDSVTLNAANGGDIDLIGQVKADRSAMPTIVDPDVKEGTLRVLASGVLARTVLA